MKTPLKLLAGSLALAFWLAPVAGWTAMQSAALPLLLGAASLGADPQSPAAQADGLLREARQAMAQGNLDAANEKISRAQALHPKYPLLYGGDTPKKARADLQKLAAKNGGKGRKNDKRSADPFLAQRADAAPAVAAPAVAANPRGIADRQAVQPVPAVEPSAQKPADDANPWHVDEPEAQPALVGNRYSGANGQAAPNQLATPQDAAAAKPDDSDSMRRYVEARAHSDALLLEARRALADGDTQFATIKIEQAKGLGVPYSGSDDSPAKVEALLQKQTALQANAAQADTDAYRRRQAELLMEQAEGLMRWKDVETAERLAAEAQRVRVAYGPTDTQPEQLLDRIARIKQTAGADRPGGHQAVVNTQQEAVGVGQSADRAHLSAINQLQRPAQPVLPADDAVVDNDRAPRMLRNIAGQDNQQRYPVVTAEGAAPADGSGAAVRAVYDPDSDTSRNTPAAALSRPPVIDSIDPTRVARQPARTGVPPALTAPPHPMPDTSPTPENGTGEGMRYYRQGVQQIAQGNTKGALTAFRRAYAFQMELDSEIRRQLHDHLRILGEPVENLTEEPAESAPSEAAPPEPSTADTSKTAPPKPDAAIAFDPGGETGQVLAQRVAVEVARQQSMAKEMREKQPRQALELLERTRNMVATVAALETPAREQLLRRLDHSIGDLKKYITENASQIELDEHNAQVQGEVDRSRARKVEVQEKLAYLVDDFNKLVDEQRYAEAQVLAKRATELDPENPVVVQLAIMSKQLQRVSESNELRDNKEEGYYAAMHDVDVSSTPFVGPMEFPDVKTWDRLTKSRSRLKFEGNMRRSPKELEIEKRLSTPVSLKFQQRPLSEVIEYLGKVAQVPVYLDPEGLRAEGVSSDTPVTIDLSQDISLKSALKLILEPLRLAFVVQDEVLKITSEDAKRGQLYPVSYPVADLVIPIPNFVPDGREGINAAFREAYSRMGFGGAAGGSFGSSAPLAALAANTQGAGTSPEALGQINPVAVPIGGGGGPPASGSSQSIPFGPGGMSGGSQADFDSLIELIRTTVGPPEIWDDMGGPGTIESFETNLSLVIYQTQEKHEEIADLLSQLRRLQDLQVTIEVRFIRLTEEFFERIGVDFDFNLVNTNPDITPLATTPPQTQTPQVYQDVNPSAVIGIGPAGTPTPGNAVLFRQNSFGAAIPQFGGFDPTQAATFGFAILSDIEAFFIIEAAQGDTRSNVLQAPKVTLFNGQMATVSDTQQRPFVISLIPVVGDFAAAQQPVIVVLSEGGSLTVQAVVSNDRRFVRLTVVPVFSQIGDVDEFSFTGSTTTISDKSESKKGDDEEESSDSETEIVEATTVQLPTFAFVTVTTTVSVPDGGTVLLGGIKRLSEGRDEAGVPVLSKLPYVNRLFRNVGIGRRTESLMMMVTPRIIIQEEEEENLLGTAAP